MIDEPFAGGNSIIHRIDPRFKVVAATFFSFTTALCYEFPTLFIALTIAVGTIFFAGVNLWQVAKRLAIVNAFVLFLWIILPLTYGGNDIYALGPVKIYLSGMILAAKITLKSNSILLVLIGCVATMSSATLGHTLNRLRMPEKLVFLFLLTYRYIFVIQQEYQKIIRSIKIRGFTPKTTLRTYKTIAYVVGMLLIRASERADRVFNAMRCRGFKGKYYSLTEFQFNAQSWIFFMILSILTVGMVVVETLYHG